MSKLRRYLCTITAGLITATGTASADRAAVVLIDKTGSMAAARKDCDNIDRNRFETAKCRAVNRIDLLRSSTEGLEQVAVYTFSTDGISLVTTGGIGADGAFVTPGTAINAINGLSMFGGVTPLAFSMCQVIGKVRAFDSGATTDRLLEVFTDGEENFSFGKDCGGPDSVSGPPEDWDLGSWQSNVYLRAVNGSPPVTVSAELYNNVALGLWATTARLSDAEFFGYLTADTGGRFTHLLDSTPLPVAGDTDGDFDVDRNDAVQLALAFGGPAPKELDLDDDGQVGFSDYLLVLSRFGTGTGTPAPDPFTQANTVTCGSRSHRVVINGKVIEDAGVTVSVRGECTVVIRNSLIVSGKSAVRVRGGADLVVEDSIIVGEGAWLDSAGTTFVSASGSVFHGAQEVRGSFEYEDLGGNTFRRPGDDSGSDPSSLSFSGDDGLVGGCSAGGGAPRSSLWIALLVAVIVVRRRRR